MHARTVSRWRIKWRAAKALISKPSRLLCSSSLCRCGRVGERGMGECARLFCNNLHSKRPAMPIVASRYKRSMVWTLARLGWLLRQWAPLAAQTGETRSPCGGRARWQRRWTQVRGKIQCGLCFSHPHFPPPDRAPLLRLRRHAMSLDAGQAPTNAGGLLAPRGAPCKRTPPPLVLPWAGGHVLRQCVAHQPTMAPMDRELAVHARPVQPGRGHAGGVHVGHGRQQGDGDLEGQGSSSSSLS